MNSKLRIAFVSNSSYSMYFFRKGVLANLVAQGYEVHVICPYDYKTPDLIELGCIHHPVNFSTRSVNPIADIKLFIRLFLCYKRIKPGLLFHYTIKPNVYGTMAASLLYIRSIAIVTGLGYVFINNTWINRQVKRLYRFALRYAYQVWFLNKSDIDDFLSNRLVAPDKVFHLPGEGVNLREFKKVVLPSTYGFTFILIARMLTDKGVYEFVEAARMLKRKYPNLRFRLLGPAESDNPTAISMKQMNEWQQSGFVEYLGSANDIRPHVANAHVVVLPSYREGVSKVLMEAAAMGRPLIASNVPGCIELIDEDVNGYLCEVRNAEDLADKMELILAKTPQELQQMGDASRQKMYEEFDEHKIISIYSNVVVTHLGKHEVIVYVVNTDWFFISHRLALALEAIKQGYKAVVIATDTGKGEWIKSQGIQFFDLNLSRSGINPFAEFRVLLKLWRLYIKLQPVIIHHVTIKPVLYGSLAARFTLLNVKVVNAISGLGYAFINTYRTLSFWIIRVLMNVVLKGRQVNYIFQNPDDLAFYKEQGYLSANNYKLIRGAGIDVHHWMYASPVIKPRLRVIFSGRLLEDKGIREFIQAAVSLRTEWEGRAEFLMIGDIDPGNPKSLTADELRSIEIPDYLCWTGHMDNMLEECVQCDIMCLPSYREGLPKALLEAMSVGRPIITTNTPGCRECVDDGSNGYLVPVKDSHVMAMRIGTLLRNRDLRLAMGHASRQKAVNEFSMDRVLSQTFQFYDQLLGHTSMYPGNQPRITIITAVYNNVRFVKDALESVLQQTYPNLEYIVIDGGSTDGSYEIIQSYAHRIHHIISEPDKGLYDALNKGISLASGEIIGIMHSDDFYAHRNVLRKIANRFGPDVDALYGNLDYISNADKGKVIRQWRSGKYRRSKFLTGWMPPHPTVFIRKTIFEKYGGYNTQLAFSSDYEILIRLFYVHRISIAFIDEVLVKMRTGGQSNRSVRNRMRSHFEDYKAWRIAGARVFPPTLFLKLLRKIPQFIH
ncbi:MAG: glycosyltransferase [Bacteroidota bacterium]